MSERYRLRLRVGLKLMGLFAIAGFMLILLSALFSRSGEHIQLPLEVDLRDIAPGEWREIRWDGRRVAILHRDASMLASLDTSADSVYDPQSRWDRLPCGLPAGPQRSWTDQWLVVYAESTDLGCPLEHQPTPMPGGFVDQCRGGRYDYAGRVYRQQAAMRNLQIPVHSITPDGQSLILGRCAP